MTAFRDRLIPFRDIVLVFAACVVPLYSWSILMFIKGLSEWLSFMSTWELIGIFAYMMVSAMLECVLIILIPIFLGVILPVRFMRDKFVALGSMLVLLTLAWLIAMQIEGINISSPLLWIFLYLLSIGVPFVLIYRSKQIEEMINSFSERLTTLLYVYVPITILSGIIVILRKV